MFHTPVVDIDQAQLFNKIYPQISSAHVRLANQVQHFTTLLTASDDL